MPKSKTQNTMLAEDIDYYLELDERGDAEMFAKLYLGQLVFDHAQRKWYLWKDNYWKEDRTGKVKLMVGSLADVYKCRAQKIEDKESTRYKQLMKRYHQLNTVSRIKNILELAANQSGVALQGDEWIVEPLQLPVKNGIVDLKTGKLKQSSPKDYINIFSSTLWQGLDCKAPLWDKFVASICNDDLVLVAFLHRLLGYAITGDTQEQIMAIFYGRGSNGKSVLMDAINYVLGGAFCYPTQADSLMAQLNSDGNAARPFVCALENKRFVWASESQDGQRLNTALVKQLTGDQSITARKLYGEPITFSVSHKIFLITNSLPELPSGGDNAIFRRLVLFPFKVNFVDDPKHPNDRKLDRGLLRKLQKEASGILAWLVRGALHWQKQGLNTPEASIEAKKAYEESQDVLGQFERDRLIEDQVSYIKAGDLYRVYVEWCDINAYAPLDKSAFCRQATKRYGKSKSITEKSLKLRVYKGVRVKS